MTLQYFSYNFINATSDFQVRGLLVETSNLEYLQNPKALNHKFLEAN